MPGRGTAGIFRLPQGRNVAIAWIAFSRWGRGTCTPGITALSTTDASNTTARAWLGDLRSEDGVTLGLVSVPDGLAMGLLAGLNPVAGCYGYLMGTVAGAVVTSSVLMSVRATGAMAVLSADVPELRAAEDPARALAPAA
jgi:MFS superfamily sulfate permease-like transporter